ncbi:MAG: DUF3857 domain-containing transglutaminase family protein [Rhodanobacteraceae bacterium]|nr:DUF3857 domain-containing transglutaminase family protein [Rhodanobacteraceae bacterium]
MFETRAWAKLATVWLAIAIPLGASASGAAAAADTLPALTDLRPAPRYVERARLAREWPRDFAADEGLSWRYWLIDTQIDERSGEPTLYFDIAFEAVTAELLGDAGRFEISFRDEFQTLQLHQMALRRDGRWQQRFRPDAVQLTRRQAEFEADLSDQRVSALLRIDDVRVGDVVRIAYSIRGENPVLGGQVDHRFPFAAGYPILARHARVLYPKGAEIDARPFQDPPAAQLSARHGGREWRASAREVPAQLQERDLPAWYIDRPTWAVARARPWAEVVAWALPMYPHDEPVPAGLQADIEQWRTRPPAERAAWALQKVQDEVRYLATILGDSSHRPGPAARTWERRYGDCKDKAQLLSTLLRALDIEASTALVSVSDGRNLGQLPPSATAFDHVIVTAQVDGERLWLDPTLAWQRGAIVQRRASVAGHALIVAPGETALTPLPEPDATAAQIEVREDYRILDPESRQVALTVETLRSGRSANSFRQSLAGGSTQELQRGFTEYYRKHFGKVRVEQPAEVSDDPARNEIRIVERYLLQDPWDVTERQSLITPSAAEVASQLLELEQAERVGPFVAAAPVRVDYEARLTLPESWRADATALAEKFESPAFHWESRREPGERELVLGHRFVGQRMVLAADQVEAHLDAVRRAQALARQGFRVIPPGQQRQGDREARLRAILKQARERAEGVDDEG